MRRSTLYAIAAAAGMAAANAVAGGAVDKVTGEFMRGNCWDCSPGDELGFVAHRLVSAHEASQKHPQTGFFLSWRDDGSWWEMDFNDPAETCIHATGAGKLIAYLRATGHQQQALAEASFCRLGLELAHQLFVHIPVGDDS